MEDGWRQPSIRQQCYGQSYLFHQPSPNWWTSSFSAHDLGSLYLRGGLHNPSLFALSLVFLVSHNLVQAPVQKKKATLIAPIERVKLLPQNHDEMIKVGRISEPYNGILDGLTRTIKKDDGFSLWRGNTANVIRYSPS
ncbi:hypothetical protein Nepgr_009145 [Nepenthes gracilis]|uniref:ADP/ATP translocase n=1 Tax=Nepenthes gracilis TaxID=150966 RepID=A0AAD3XK36_NEPGR|nr:hypothetical protein Nepgr_009145 [Nepenthes gracilis]